MAWLLAVLVLIYFYDIWVVFSYRGCVRCLDSGFRTRSLFLNDATANATATSTAIAPETETQTETETETNCRKMQREL